MSLVVQEYSRHTLREAFGCSHLIIAAAKMQGVNSQSQDVNSQLQGVNSQLQGVNSQLQGVNSQLQSSYHRCCEDAGCEFSVTGCEFSVAECEFLVAGLKFSVAVILSSLLRRCTPQYVTWGFPTFSETLNLRTSKTNNDILKYAYAGATDSLHM